MAFIHQLVHVCDCTVRRVNTLIVSYVVAHVNLRAVVRRADLDDIYTKSFDVVKTFCNTRKVVNAIGVFVARGVDLVHDIVFLEATF